MAYRYNREILAVPCDDCGAQPGNRCKGKKTGVTYTNYVHDSRAKKVMQHEPQPSGGNPDSRQ